MTPQSFKELGTAAQVDTVFLLIFGVSALMLLGITGTMVYFVIRYHRSRNPRPTSQAASNLWLEVTWTLLPTLIVLAIFYYGWTSYLSMQKAPDDALELKVTARMWSWSVEYPNGKVLDRLIVPVKTPIQIALTATDVLHSFYAPAFRVKRDTVPGMTTYIWFQADDPGTYHVYCAEYCGVGHSSMNTTIEALPQQDYEKWYGGTVQDTAPAGKELLTQTGCIGCHSLDGTGGVGPTFLNLYGNERQVVTNGEAQTIHADSEYLIRSIRSPKADIVQGYPPIMPPYPGLSDDEIQSILQYLKSISENP